VFYKGKHETLMFKTNVTLIPSQINGLDKKSVADCLQTRPIDYRLRLSRVRGRLEHADISLIGDLCITPPFARLLRQAQILILEIFNVFLWLKLSPSLYLAKIGRSSKVSIDQALKVVFSLEK